MVSVVADIFGPFLHEVVRILYHACLLFMNQAQMSCLARQLIDLSRLTTEADRGLYSESRAFSEYAPVIFDISAEILASIARKSFHTSRNIVNL